MNLYLMGFRGCGKTAAGLLVAQLLGLRHRDTDDLVEGLTGCSIQQIFAERGEAEFRRRESEVIRTFRPDQTEVVSLGGGAILGPENRDRLRATGLLVWLKASAETLFERIQQDPATISRRPPLSDLGGLDETRATLRMREPIYAACADFTVDVEKMSPTEVADTIVHWWKDDRFNSSAPRVVGS